jgi:hypothetical protein
MNLRHKSVFFRLSWRGRRELREIEFFAEKESFEARVVEQDGVGVWIQMIQSEPEEARKAGPAELLKWEYIAAATVGYQPEPQ